MNKKTPVPEHLEASTRKWFSQIVGDFELESHHLRILEMAGAAWDEYQTARKAVAKHGQTYIDRYDQPRERPEVGIARQARVGFARLIRELALDVEPPPSTRLPRTGGQQH